MRKRVPFFGKKKSEKADPNMVSTKVTRKVNKKKGRLNQLTADEKMLCAIRKALASKSGLAEAGNARYYVSGDELYVLSRGGGVQTKKDEPTTYTARGRFKLGMVHDANCCFRIAEFNITFKDTVDERGIPDVDFLEPTTIDLLPKGAKLAPAA